MRMLKKNAAEAQNHVAEQKFFRMELLSKPLIEENNFLTILSIYAYEWFSKCGMSVKRPLVWLLVCMVSFFCAYWQLQPKELFFINRYDSGVDCFGVIELNDPLFIKLFSYTFSQTIPFLGIFKDNSSYVVDYLWGKPEQINFMVGALSVIQNLISTVFLFLFLLGVRNYFKLR